MLDSSVIAETLVPFDPKYLSASVAKLHKSAALFPVCWVCASELERQLVTVVRILHGTKSQASHPLVHTEVGCSGLA